MKWNAWLASLETRDAPPIDPPLTMGGHTEHMNQQDDSVPTSIIRPLGRDKAKKLRTSSSTASNSTAYLEMLQKFQEDRVKYEQQIVASASEESKIKINLKERLVKATEESLRL